MLFENSTKFSKFDERERENLTYFYRFYFEIKCMLFEKVFLCAYKHTRKKNTLCVGAYIFVQILFFSPSLRFLFRHPFRRNQGYRQCKSEEEAKGEFQKQKRKVDRALLERESFRDSCRQLSEEAHKPVLPVISSTSDFLYEY